MRASKAATASASASASSVSVEHGKTRGEVGFFPDEEHGGVLPNAPIGVHALPTTAPCKEIKGGCPEEKKKTGDARSSPPNASVLASLVEASGRDCDDEQIECFKRCWKSKPPWPMKKASAAHYGYCQTKCLKEYMQCLGEEGLRRTFDSLQEAADWLKHHPGVVVGTIVMIVGVAYVVSTGGTGVLLLLPLGA